MSEPKAQEIATIAVDPDGDIAKQIVDGIGAAMEAAIQKYKEGELRYFKINEDATKQLNADGWQLVCIDLEKSHTLAMEGDIFRIEGAVGFWMKKLHAAS